MSSPFHLSITHNIINNKTFKNNDTEFIIKNDNIQNNQNVNILNSNNTVKSASDSNTMNLMIINDPVMLKNFFSKLREIIGNDIMGDNTNEMKILIINEIKAIYEFIMNNQKSDELQKKNEQEQKNHINEKCCKIFEKKKLNQFTLYGNCDYSKVQCLEKEMINLKSENVNLKNEMKIIKKKLIQWIKILIMKNFRGYKIKIK